MVSVVIQDPNTQEIFKYYVEDKLEAKIKRHILPSLEKKDEDYVIVVDGHERCQPVGSKVLMNDGTFKNIENLEVGDRIISPQKNGKNIFANVIKKCSWYCKENYDVITLNKGKKKLYSCSYNHPIPIYSKIRPRKNGKRLYKDSYWKVKHYSAKHFSSLSIKSTKKNSTSISSFSIDKFENRQNCEIEPYTLGLWLGDGCFVNSNFNITSNTPKCLEEVKKYYKIIRVSEKKGTTAKTYNFSKVGLLGKQLRKSGLEDKRSGDKFIPKEALFSDINYRKRLLAGLIDSDGYLSKKDSYSITTKSKKLADEILFLIYTIGGRGNIRKVKKQIRKLGFEGTYFTVSFYIGKMNLPIQIEKKIKKGNCWYLSPNRVSVDVIKSKPSLVYGIEIDSPSKWYITDNFMITHNTGKSTFAMQLARRIDPAFNLDRVCFSPDEFRKAVIEAEKGQAVVFDEAYRGLSSRGALTEVNKLLVSMMVEMGQKNLCVIIVLPTFFLLERYVALWRARGLFHIYKSRGKKGYWIGFGRKKKKLIYLQGKKDYTYRVKAARSTFKGRFYGKYVIDEEAYRKKKEKTFREGFRTSKREKFKQQRDNLIWLVKKELDLSQRDLQTMFQEYKVGMKKTIIGDVLRKRTRVEENKGF